MTRYQISLKGNIELEWIAGLGDVTATQGCGNGAIYSVVLVNLEDGAKLMRILQEMDALGATLLSLYCLDPEQLS